MTTTLTGPDGTTVVTDATIVFEPITRRPTIEQTRRAEAYIGINGVNIWGSIKEYVTEIEYTDVADGETDSFDLTLVDTEKHWVSDWLIDKGTQLEAKIKLLNWIEPNDELWIDCGTFLCDALKVRGLPFTATIQSLALPLNGTEHTQKWESISISAIANEICYRLGCELKYYASDVTLKSRQQSRQKDIDFLFRLCDEYGLGMKVYRNSVVIFNREEQDAADAVDTFDISEFLSDEAQFFSLEDNEEGTFTGVQCTYKPDESDDEITYTYGTDERMIILSTSANSAAEAELKGKAALYNANIEAVKLKISALGGMKPIYAGSNYYITGLGGYSGKYAIERVTHTISGEKSYRISIEAHAVALEKDGGASVIVYGESSYTATPSSSSSSSSSISGGSLSYDLDGSSSTTSSGASEISELINRLTGGSGGSSGGGGAGAAVNLSNAPLYISSDAESPVRYISGTYYLYDGKSFSGRYRICGEGDAGKTPVGEYVIGYVDGSYI